MKVLAESSALRARKVRSDRKPVSPVTAHESVYRQLKDRILFGGFKPGEPVTLRGIALDLQVGLMPIREAVRRLIAERALEMRDNRRVLVPPMSKEKFEQILYARLAFEPDLAARSCAHLTPEIIDGIEAIDNRLDLSVLNGDAERYMRGNFQFHFAIYERAGADMLAALVESVWLQFGPFMRMAYGRVGTGDLTDHHEEAIAAMRAGKPELVRCAIANDISQGMGFIGESVLDSVQ